MGSKTFNGQSGWQRWDVPDGVTRVTVDLQGAGTGSTKGGRVRGTVKVRKGDRLYLLVGTQGEAASGRQGGSGGHGGGGAGGDGSGGNNGGRGGGGAAAIRLNSSTGTIKVVAGGAGGRSGDAGSGGQGGGTIGDHGSLGTTTGGGVGNATGGTQIQGGAGGASSISTTLTGHDGGGRLGTGGRGGQNTNLATEGGGGGGGGFYPGGGGAAARVSMAPGGGGGGGSNYTGGLLSVTSNEQGGGNTGDAQIVLTWVSPAPSNQPPSTPSDVKIDGKAKADGMSTRSTGTVTVSAIVRDPDSSTVDPVHDGDPATQHHAKARLLVRYSTSSKFNHVGVERSEFVDYGKRATLKLTGLNQNTRYYLRLYAEDKSGKVSSNYSAANFWTNRNPTEPNLITPGDNSVVLDTDATSFDWTPQDPDDNDGQSAFTLRWRKIGAQKWQEITKVTSFSTYVQDPRSFKAGVYYEWTARTRDQQNRWGPYATPRSFYVQGSTNPPVLRHPADGQSVDVSGDVTLTFDFRDPTDGATQTKADYRYRAVGTEDWVTVFGDTTIPGASRTWVIPENTLLAGVHYEWQARTYSSVSPLIASDWSDAEDFWTHGGIGAQAIGPVTVTTPQGNLGTGHNRAFIYDRGGLVLRGEVTPLAQVNWNRARDDISEATVTTNGFGVDCGQLLLDTHTWIHELVIFRDGVRVFEGPITHIDDTADGFVITAKDVMGYVLRRIIKQGFNDHYHLVQGLEEGLMTVVDRAGLIIADALARDDPNVLPYLTLLTYPDDARQARSVDAYSKTAWDEVDDMAANAGLDYTVIGRRIILNDTHRAVGRLPEWRGTYFSQPPKITEYGMLLSTEYGVTNGTGLWGSVIKEDSPYGLVELLVSSFTEVGGDEGEKLTNAQKDAVRKVLTEQARRGIASRYPAPYIVRVPDNATLLPDTPVGINQLVPGVWIPLRTKGTVIELSQWQKLDTISCTEVGGAGDVVTVSMSPAPNAGQDPDAEGIDASDGAVT